MVFEFLEVFGNYFLPPQNLECLTLLSRIQKGGVDINSPDIQKIFLRPEKLSLTFRHRTLCIVIMVSSLPFLYFIFAEGLQPIHVSLIIKTFFNFALLYLCKYNYVSIMKTGTIYIVSVFISNVIVIVLSNAIGLVFLRIYVTNFPILTLGAFYFLRGNSGLIFAFFSICVTSYFFFLSLDQPTMVTLSTKDHTGFFISSIVHQIIPVILFKLYENESIHYQNLLSKFLESAEQKNIAKTNYISQMSHDLRTPLHGFLSIAELMKKSNLNEEQLSYLRAMDSCGNLILDIVMKILDLSKIEAGKFEPTFEKFSLFSIVQETFDSLSTLADSKSNQFLIHFQLNPIGFTVLGDRTHFREILVNLIGNALKFTENGKVQIQIAILNKTQKFRSQKSKNQQFYRFEIQDSGIGISENHLPTLFEKFTQTNSTQKQRDGSGLGLSITKTFTEALGGTISVESHVNKGTKFLVDLPFESIHDNSFETLYRLPNVHSRTSSLHNSRFGVYSRSDFGPILADYFSVWKLNHKYIRSVIQCLDCDVLFIDSDFNFLEELINYTKSSKQSIDYTVIFLTSLSSYSEIKAQLGSLLNEDELQKVVTLTHPLGPLKIKDALISLFQNQQQQYQQQQYQQQQQQQQSFPYGQFESTQKFEQNNRLTTQTSNLQKFKEIVIVVEDNEVNQMIMKKILENARVDYFITSSGEEAVTFFQNSRSNIPLIFMDIEVNGCYTGLEAASLIRNQESKRNSSNRAHIICMSGRIFGNEEERAKDHGCDEFLLKPVSPQKISDILRKYLILRS